MCAILTIPVRKSAALFSVLWMLLPGPGFGQLTDTSRVALHDKGNYWEVENGWIGVRLPKTALFHAATPAYAPAPIHCIIYKDGALSGDAPNYLTSPAPPLSMMTEVLYQTTDSCAVRVSYSFDKPELNNGVSVLEPAGPGYYRATVRLGKGEKAAIVTEESDFEVGFAMKVSNALSPDKGRYEGHNATSVANGYDIFGQTYNKGERTGWQATVDLGFSQKKTFEPLARWNPWVSNSGWHWQLYNSTASPTANIFGIFDGRPSVLLGAAASGARIYTEPAAAADLHAACDANGECHYAWLSENRIFYKKIAADGTAAAEELAATGLIRPFVFQQGNTLNIFAINPLDSATPVRLLKKTGNSAFQNLPVSLDATLDDPFVYGASNGAMDFLVIRGTRNGQSGLLLYGAAANTTAFVFKDLITDATAWRAANRPDFKRMPNGDLALAYANGLSRQQFAVVLNGQEQFTHPQSVPFSPEVTFGMGLDARTGSLFFVTSNGAMHSAKLDGATATDYRFNNPGAPINHAGFEEANRRNVAFNVNGDGLAFHEGFFYRYSAAAQSWSVLLDQEWQGVVPAQVNFNPLTGLFYFLGKHQGKLARFSFSGTGLPQLVETFNSTERPVAGVQVSHSRLSPSGAYFPDIRFSWGIFAGNKGDDLPPADQVQPIARTMHRLSGLAKKVEAYENDPALVNDVFSTGGIYIPADAVQDLIQKVRTDDAFYQQMSAVDPYFKGVMDAWREGGSGQTDKVYQSVIAFAEGLKEALKNGDGIYSFAHLYTQGGNDMRRFITLAAGLMADTKLTTAQREQLKKTIALFARVLWDDDFVPFFLEHGMNLGNTNMASAYLAHRWFFGLLLSHDPEFSSRAAEIPVSLRQAINEYINEYGAPKGTPHYLQPAMDGLIFTALQLANEGFSDEFATNDRLRPFADFVLRLLTPPSVRFSENRKLICFGDGTEESAAIFGLMATGFANSDPWLSRRLMNAYRNGPARGSDFGIVTIAINHSLPEQQNFAQGSKHFPGYLTATRTEKSTPQESATWFVNGDWYSDHRNDDRGAVAIYALGAPLSLNYGSFYSPFAPGAHLKSTLTPLSIFPQWNQANQPLFFQNDLTWDEAEHIAFNTFKNSAFSSARFKKSDTWTRRVFHFHPYPEAPFFVIEDSLNNAAADYIWNFNFVARDVVGTPVGPVDPPAGIWNYQTGPTDLPAGSPSIALPSGMNRFDFTGIPWPAHPSGGIDWELYLTSDNPQEASLAEWAHTFIPTTELKEFEATNNTTGFEERQTMMRVKGKSAFRAMIVPFFKGMRPKNLVAAQNGQTLTLDADDFHFETDLKYAFYEGGGKSVLTTFTPQTLARKGASIGKGAMELEITADTVYARLHGTTGLREVKLPPGTWSLLNPSTNAAFDAGTGKWNLDFTETDSFEQSGAEGYFEYIFAQTDTSVAVSEPLAMAPARLTIRKIYPNPVRNEIFVEFYSPVATPVDFALVQENGFRLLQGEKFAQKGGNHLVLSTAHLPQGFYTINLSNGDEITSKPLVKAE
jgi:hypothetical protein